MVPANTTGVFNRNLIPTIGGTDKDLPLDKKITILIGKEREIMKYAKKIGIILVLLLIAVSISFLSVSCQKEEKSAEADAAEEEAMEMGPVTVGSKIDTEGALLGQMIVLLLEENGFEVEDRTEFGTTDVVRSALKNGEIDIYPEYTGTAAFLLGIEDQSILKSPEEGYQTVKEMDKEQFDIVWLEASPANNTWAIATRRSLAEEENVQTLEDMARYVNNGGFVKLACSEEFATRDDALPAFEEAYGFELSSNQLVILSGGNTAQTEKAAAEGTDDVNFAMAYGTDGAIAALDLVVLEDTKNVQTVYRPAPTVRGEVMDEYPEIADILDPVFEDLTLEVLQELNGRIVVQGEIASSVAEDYLSREGFLE
jgi:osmoprotectant transport system substrate-binding protein